MIEEFVIIGNAGWCQAGGCCDRPHSLEHELRQRPDMIDAFGLLFHARLTASGQVPAEQSMVSQPEGLEGSSSPAAMAFVVRGVSFHVVRHTWNAVCLVSKFRREGLVICHLPAGMLLVCSFRRPVLAHQAIPAVEKACELLWK